MLDPGYWILKLFGIGITPAGCKCVYRCDLNYQD